MCRSASGSRGLTPPVPRSNTNRPLTSRTRWDHAEVLKALLAEEVSGRDRSALATRRARAGFPTGKTFAAWDPALSSIPAPFAGAPLRGAAVMAGALTR